MAPECGSLSHVSPISGKTPRDRHGPLTNFAARGQRDVARPEAWSQRIAAHPKSAWTPCPGRRNRRAGQCGGRWSCRLLLRRHEQVRDGGTQDPELAARLDPVAAGRRLANYLQVITLEAQAIARA